MVQTDAITEEAPLEMEDGRQTHHTQINHISTSVEQLTLLPQNNQVSPPQNRTIGLDAENVDAESEDELYQQCLNPELDPFPDSDSDISYSPSSPSLTDPLEYDLEKVDNHYFLLWGSDPNGYHLALPDEKPMWIVLLEGQGSEFRRSAREIRGVVSGGTAWTSVIQHVRSIWREFSHIKLPTATDGWVLGWEDGDAVELGEVEDVSNKCSVSNLCTEMARHEQWLTWAS